WRGRGLPQGFSLRIAIGAADYTPSGFVGQREPETARRGVRVERTPERQAPSENWFACRGQGGMPSREAWACAGKHGDASDAMPPRPGR
ncbi:MAG: hypothetical protein ABIP48_12225, partial [Planctomycetota bacterium]